MVVFCYRDRFFLQTSSAGRTPASDDASANHYVFLGDDKPIVLGDTSAVKQSSRLSAKQRR